VARRDAAPLRVSNGAKRGLVFEVGFSPPRFAFAAGDTRLASGASFSGRALFFSPKSQELEVDGQELHDGLADSPALLHQRGQLTSQALRQHLRVFFAPKAAGQSPHGMPRTVCAVTRRLATSPVGHGQMTSERIFWQSEPANEPVFALSKTRSLPIFGGKTTLLYHGYPSEMSRRHR
jgi:hypothetical protein